MNQLLDRALSAVRNLPEEEQDDIARLMLNLAERSGSPEPIDPAHLPGVLEGLDQFRRGEFANDEQVEAAFKRFDR